MSGNPPALYGYPRKSCNRDYLTHLDHGLGQKKENKISSIQYQWSEPIKNIKSNNPIHYGEIKVSIIEIIHSGYCGFGFHNACKLLQNLISFPVEPVEAWISWITVLL